MAYYCRILELELRNRDAVFQLVVFGLRRAGERTKHKYTVCSESRSSLLVTVQRCRLIALIVDG